MIRESNKFLLEQKYATLLDMTNTGIYELDTTSSTGLVTGFISNILKVKDSSQVSLDEYLFNIAEQYRDNISNVIKQNIKRLEPLSLNIPIEKDDKLVWLTVNGQKVDNSLYFLVHTLATEEPVAYDINIDSSLIRTLNLIPVPLMILREDERIVFINSTFTDVTGYSSDDIPDVQKWVNYAYGEKSEEIYTIIKDLFNIRKRADDGHFQVRTKSGNIKSFNFFTVPFGKDKEGKKHILSIAADSPELHNKDRLINQQNEELDILHERLPYLLITADPQGEILYVNNNAVEYTGYPMDYIKNNWISLIHKEDQQMVLEKKVRSVQTGEIFNADLRLKRYDDVYHWINFKIIPVKDHNKKIIKWLGAGIDIHEQYLSQQQLTHSLKTEVSHLNEIIESLPQLAWTADAKGNIDYFNKRWYEFTNQKPESSLSNGWSMAQHPDDLKSTRKVIEAALEKGEEIEVEIRFLSGEDRNFFWHLVKILPVKSGSGRVKYWVGTATNIHEQKMLEYNKGEFLNVASHELRTPLTTLLGYLQLMDIAIQNNDFSNQPFYVNKSISATNRINRLINDLLNLSNVESGKISGFENEKIDFEALVEEIVNSYRQLHPLKKFNFSKEGSRFYTVGDAFRLEQVIDNLISNGLKYAPSSPIDIHLKKTEAGIMLEVSDKGKGIPENKLSAIFDRFYRIKDSAVSSGLGIGLFISREIIHQHRGRIWAESNENEGTAFKFVIPAA